MTWHNIKIRMANRDNAESPEEGSRPNTRGGRGKNAAPKNETPNNRRKSEASTKSSNKRSKGNNGSAIVDPALDPHEDDGDESQLQESSNGKKMADEEKRRNFLERNRVAALKCRQRKKQWLANLQAKVEMYSAENEFLNQQFGQIHEETRSLRALLMSHKDCPVGHAQGTGQFFNGVQDPNSFSVHANP